MKMTRPLSAMFLLARCIVKNAPRTLISTKRSICSSLSSTTGTPRKLNAGVGDDDVEGTELLLCLGEEAVDVRWLGDVGLDGDRLYSMFAHFGQRLLGADGVGGVVEDDVGTQFRVAQGDRLPDTSG